MAISRDIIDHPIGPDFTVKAVGSPRYGWIVTHDATDLTVYTGGGLTLSDARAILLNHIYRR